MSHGSWEGTEWVGPEIHSMQREMREAAARIADLERQLSEAREVKPLVFRQMLREEMEAESVFGVYLLDGDDWKAPDFTGWRKGGIRAAQADYNSRILSALKDTP